ncbi:MAG: isoprenylcysteine carboxylmethyltransferase family protein [Terriglobales bacterium]|jgi:protein-S-isoprenylcysteine O-methyltransferase Ste14
MMQWLNLLGWLACVVYSTIPCFWFLVHPWAEHWRSRKRSPYVVLLPAWAAMWVVMGLTTARWRNVALYATRWMWVPALVLFGIGLWLYAQSSKNFSARQLGGFPEVISGHGEQRLVMTGIRARMRHPVYLAHLCEMLVWSIGTGLVVCYGLTAFAVVTGAVMIGMEDRELEVRFGEEYRRYKARVPTVAPKRQN